MRWLDVILAVCVPLAWGLATERLIAFGVRLARRRPTMQNTRPGRPQ